MNELLELQNRGYYIVLTLMPGGDIEIYIDRWDDDNFNSKTRFGLDTIKSAIAFAMEVADEYESIRH